MSNKEIAKILYEISQILEMQNVPFKPRAYEKAAMGVEASDLEAADIYKSGGIKALEQIPGIGTSIAEKIEELLKTNRLKYYADLKKKFPINISELSAIEGLGAKTIATLYKKLGVKNLKTLGEAARKGKISRLPHFGEQSEKKILQGIEFVKTTGSRMLLSEALPLAEKIIKQLQVIKGVKKIVFAGSLRRMQETIGDLDLLAVSDDPQLIMEAFVKLPEVETVHARGKTYTSLRLKNGHDADLRVLPPSSFGAALQYFTGDKYHNIAIRTLAEKMGYKLNEYGLWRGKKNIAGRTEEEIYAALKMATPPPELRTATGELPAAQKYKLPRLIGYDDIKGDLQIQTDWTDGANSIEEMAKAAQQLGYKYIAITDHTKTLAMTGGSDETKLAKQGKEIDRLNSKFRNFKIFKSAEVNIMKDGSLDIKNNALKKLDIVAAAVHSNFHMTKDEMTVRIVRAMQNPYLNILFHPTGRIINRREAYQLDMDAIIAAAKKYGVILEIDAFPSRLDLKDVYIRKAVASGVKLVIDTDAHDKSHLQFMKYGVGQARRGWAKKSDILNTKSPADLIKAIKKMKGK
jgi:DNA polymerase (family 10)